MNRKIMKKNILVTGCTKIFYHLIELFQKTEISAAACGSIFHFRNNSPLRARCYLKNQI